MTHPFEPAPPARAPEIDAMIRAARQQSAPVVNVSVEDIRAAASAGRTVRWWGALAVASVVAISIWAVQTRPSAQTTVGAGGGSQVASAEDSVPVPARQPAAQQGQAMTDTRAVPSSFARIEPLEGAEEAASNEDGVVVLETGRYRIRATDGAMVVSVAGRVLDISAASEVVVDARLEHRSFRVVKGDAKWSEPEASPAGPGAKQLASQAEAALLSGRLEEASRLLRRLVQAHPRGPAAKAALIDLARLEKRLGRSERAHCAYALFSKRFPTDARAPTVRRADDALGLSGSCRGLRPISK